MPGINTVSICGSMSFIDQMEQLAGFARQEGYTVAVPQREEIDIDRGSAPGAEALTLKRRYIDGHLVHIRTSDLVLLANYPKHDIAGYVGPNTLVEAAFGYALGIPVATLFEPGPQPCKLEIDALSAGAIGPSVVSWTARLNRLLNPDS